MRHSVFIGRIITLTMLGAVLTISAFTQNMTATWVFGDGYVLRWSSGGQLSRNPVLTRFSPLRSVEGTACISDSCSGKLTFQSDGLQIWNGDGMIIDGSQGLCSGISSRQNVVFVPWKGHPDNVFLFAAISAGPSGPGFDPIPRGRDCPEAYTYSLITKQPNGIYKVTLKNVALSPRGATSPSEIIAATGNHSGDGYWVLTYDFFADQIFAYLVDSSGVHAEPVASNVPEGALSGQLQVSPDGRRVAIVSRIISIYNFDNKTGRLSKQANLGNFDPNSSFYKKYYSDFQMTESGAVNFSPNSELLYVTQQAARRVDGKDQFFNRVLQFDLALADSEKISNSIEVVYETSERTKQIGYRTALMNLGIDGRLWLNMRSYLDAIEYPDRRGIECGYAENVIPLPKTSMEQGYSFPTIINSDVILASNTKTCRPPWSSIVGDTICIGTCAVVRTTSMNDAKTWKWYTPGSKGTFMGSDTAIVCYDKPGEYDVFVTIGNDYGYEEVHTKVLVRPQPHVRLSVDTLACKSASAMVTASNADRVTWISPEEIIGNVSTRVEFAVRDTVVVTVVASSNDGCSDTATSIVRRLKMDMNISGDTFVCAGSTVKLRADGAHRYKWFGIPQDATLTDSTTEFTIQQNADVLVIGMDTLWMCSDSVRHHISVYPPPVVQASRDTAVCLMQPIQLSATGAYSYKWIPEEFLDDPNSATPIAHAPSTTRFVVYGTDTMGCMAADTVTVSTESPGYLRIANDTSICEGTAVQLTAESSSPFIEWVEMSTGKIVGLGPVLTVAPATTSTYIARTVRAICLTTDSVTIVVKPPQQLQAGNDTVVCQSSIVELYSSAGDSTTWMQTDGAVIGRGATLVVQPKISSTYIAIAPCSKADTVHIVVKSQTTIEARVGTSTVVVGGQFSLPLNLSSNLHGEQKIKLAYDGRLMMIESVEPGQLLTTKGSGTEYCETEILFSSKSESLHTLSGSTYLAPVVTSTISPLQYDVDSCLTFRSVTGSLAVTGCELANRGRLTTEALGILSSYSPRERLLTLRNIQMKRTECYHLELRSLTGAIVFQADVNMPSSQTTFAVSLDSVPNGIYMVTFHQQDLFWNGIALVY